MNYVGFGEFEKEIGNSQIIKSYLRG